jgi:hypothetical protein
MLTFVCGWLADITLSRRLFLVKNALTVCIAPLEVLISLLYWGIRAVFAFLAYNTVCETKQCARLTGDSSFQIGRNLIPGLM